MSATQSASTGMPYLKPKLMTVTLSRVVAAVPKSSVMRSWSWWTLKLEVSSSTSASPRMSAMTSRSRRRPWSSRPPACSGWGRRAASWRLTSTSSVASRKSSVVGRPVTCWWRLACRESKNEPSARRRPRDRLVDAAAVVDQADDVAHQGRREVVDHEVAEVLQLLGGRAATGSRHAGDDDQLAG